MTLIVILAAGAAIVSGREVLADRAEARPVPEATPVTVVSVERIVMQTDYQVTRAFSGQVEARQQTDLAFELAGTISEVLVREGDAIAEGQPIARLDTSRLEAERARLEAQIAAMEAQAELARRTAARQTELRERGFATDQIVDDTSLPLARLEAEIDGLVAGRAVIDVNLSKSVLLAPFDGTVAARVLDAGAVASPGSPVATLIETGPARFRVGLAPDLADQLAVGAPAEVLIGEMPQAATLVHVAPDLDPITRARTAIFELDRAKVPPRSTGELRLTGRVAADGAWVPLSALRQGPRGTWTLLVLRDETMAVEAAEILHLEAERAFVRGTFRDGDAYLLGGTHRVVPGQRAVAAEVTAWRR